MSIWNRNEKWPDRHETLTPSNTVNFANPVVVISNGTGTVVVVDRDDVAISYNVTPGQIIPVLAKRVNATGTTATPLIGVY